MVGYIALGVGYIGLGVGCSLGAVSREAFAVQVGVSAEMAFVIDGVGNLLMNRFSFRAINSTFPPEQLDWWCTAIRALRLVLHPFRKRAPTRESLTSSESPYAHSESTERMGLPTPSITARRFLTRLISLGLSTSKLARSCRIVRSELDCHSLQLLGAQRNHLHVVWPLDNVISSVGNIQPGSSADCLTASAALTV
jgi:hypothetical protein